MCAGTALSAIILTLTLCSCAGHSSSHSAVCDEWHCSMRISQTFTVSWQVSSSHLTLLLPVCIQHLNWCQQTHSTPGEALLCYRSCAIWRFNRTTIVALCALFCVSIFRSCENPAFLLDALCTSPWKSQHCISFLGGYDPSRVSACL
jgi:hypothetical protein